MNNFAAIYARSATDELGTREKLEAQLAVGRRLALEEGYTVVHEASEVGSGLNCNNPGLSTIRGMIERGEVDALVCTSIDRLTRSPRCLQELVSLLEARGVRLFLASSPGAVVSYAMFGGQP